MSESYSKQNEVSIPAYVRTEVHGYVSGLKSDSDSTTNFFQQSATETFTGVKNSSWRRQIKAGLNATTNSGGTRIKHKPDFFDSEISTLDITRGGLPLTRAWSGQLPIYSFAPTTAASGSVVTDVRNRCLRSFYSKAKTVQSSVELGQDLGEWKETLHAFTSPFASLRGLITGHYSRLAKAKKLYRNNTPSLRKALADSYLEFTFGWKPLALDIADAYAGLATRSRMTDVMPISAHASAPFGGSTAVQSTGTGFPGVSAYQTNSGKYSERLKGAIRVNIGANGLVPLMDVFQLSTVENFVTTAWDLIPYSFLVDYFTNAGDIISSFCYSKSNIAWHCLTTRTLNSRIWRISENGNSKYNPGSETLVVYRYRGGNASSESIVFTRTVPSLSSLVPTLQFSLPNSNKPWLNIGALILGGSLPLVPFFK